MCADNQRWDQLFGDTIWIREHIHRIEQRLETIMSEDVAIQAVTADMATQLTTLSGVITQVLAEISSGTVQPSTVAALQAEQASLDSTVAGFSADVNPPVQAPPAS